MGIIINVDGLKRERFCFGEIEKIPRSFSAIYFLLDERFILYIGKSRNLRERLKRWHRVKYDSFEMQKIKYFFYDGIENHCLDECELTNIAHYLPAYNIAGKTRQKLYIPEAHQIINHLEQSVRKYFQVNEKSI